MKVSDNLAPSMIQAVIDAIKFNQSLLESETIRDAEDLEEYLLTLNQLLGHLSDEYKKIEDEVGIPLSQLLPQG